MYIITPSALEQFAAAAPGVGKHLMFERDMFPILAEKNLLAGFVAEGTFYDCGTFERWEKAIREV
jgi:NDP-sugar pyrophosphorylase family protein